MIELPSKELIIKTHGLKYGKSEFYNLSQNEYDKSLSQSYLGTPVFSNLIIEGGSYESGGRTISYEGIVIDTVLFEISQVKNIVKTSIEGRDGTVKEYISDGDYDVKIKGALVSKSNQYPKQEMDVLVQILKAKTALNVTSDFLRIFSIHSLVIESYAVPQSEGFLNTQGFELSCISDAPVELKLNR
jgi:hypothetical protein